MDKLLKGILRFRSSVKPGMLQSLQQVAKKASPQVMMVTCMDSRLLPSCFMDTHPGDMFVVRNAGNFIPHARLFGQDNSAAMAAIELALKECNVEHLVVCGHSNCKAMDFLYHHREHGSDNESDKKYPEWIMCHGNPSLTMFEKLELQQKDGINLMFGSKANGGVVEAIIDEENKLDAIDKLSQVNVLQQLHNVRSFSFVRERLDKGLVQLHGLWFDIGEGETYMFSKPHKKFVAVNEETVETVFNTV